MADKCILDPERECLGFQKAKDVEADLKALTGRLNEFQQAVTETNGRFGGRIGKLEAQEEVREEQFKNLKERLESIAKDMSEFQREQKGSIAELRKEHKESMEELKKGNKDILETIAPLKHKAEEIDRLAEDVEELKGKSGKTWEDIKSKAIGWVVLLVLGIIAATLGLSNFT